MHDGSNDEHACCHTQVYTKDVNRIAPLRNGGSMLQTLVDPRQPLQRLTSEGITIWRSDVVFNRVGGGCGVMGCGVRR